jgi:pimeloyl-ACP methyl ester carboxylesterase
MTASLFSRRQVLPLVAMAAAVPLAAHAQSRPDINVRSVGDGPKTWVLIHPYSGSGRFWEARAAKLAATHGVRVLCPDLPSHGQSRLVEHFSYDRAADAVADAIAAYKDSTALLVGASSGAIVAMKLAARWARPVVALGGWFAFEPVNTEKMRAQARALPPEAVQFANAFLEQGPPQLAAFQRHYEDFVALGQTRLLSEAEAAALARRALLINGAADKSFSRASALALADAIPGSVLSFVGGADHLDALGAAHAAFTWAQIDAFAATRA